MMGRLFWKIFIGFWLTLVLIAVGVGLAVHWHNQNRLLAVDDLAEGPRSNFVINATALALRQGGAPAVQALFADTPDRRLPMVLIVDEQGKDLFGRLVPPAALELARARATSGERHHRFMSGARRVIAADGREYVLFIPRESGKGRDRAVQPDPLYLQLLVALLASLMFSATLAWYLARPVRHLRDAAQRLAKGELQARVMPLIGRRRDEIADLGRDFDHMAEHLQALVDAQQRLLHDVSHELRSPLARLHVAIGLAQQQPDKLGAALQRIERESVRLDELVGQLLTLSRLQAKVSSETPEDIELGALLEDVVEDARFEAEAQQRRVNLQCEAEARLHGRPELLRRAFENVIRNAVKYTPAGSEVEVQARRDATGQYSVIDVCDQGPGVAEAELTRIFEPFVRAGDAATGGRDGYGLGLAIAQRAIEAHGGEVNAYNSETGGLCIRVRLPLQDPARPE